MYFKKNLNFTGISLADFLLEPIKTPFFLRRLLYALTKSSHLLKTPLERQPLIG